jgi:transposase-like protein
MPKKKRKRPAMLRDQLMASLTGSDETLNAIATRSDVSPQVLYRFVGGSRQELRLSTIDKLLHHFQITIDAPKGKRSK